MNQMDVAHRLGCSRAFVSQLERGLKAPGPKLLDRLSIALGLPVRESVQLSEMAALSRGSIPIPSSMPLSVRRKIFHLCRVDRAPSTEDWTKLEDCLAALLTDSNDAA
ncbi:transcriptional regulator with XRE-family HTH domain [Paraburkholderia bryophila]|uniref:Transcriptional regulator with XRE-family HTH domain n=2 Tax=Paraburkholderia bryophila TaxID=420952 RepID=A0A7Z0B8H2_9BURK|nr:transcriptional regulator with XRE-family HTH domain [Paraburkholderia bryophila]